MLMTAGAMGVTAQRQQLAFDQQVTGRTDNHRVRIRHTIQPVEGIDEIYLKTPALSCRAAHPPLKRRVFRCELAAASQAGAGDACRHAEGICNTVYTYIYLQSQSSGGRRDGR